jgi:hypothetical protein
METQAEPAMNNPSIIRVLQRIALPGTWLELL